VTQDNTNYGRDQNIINQPGTVIIHGQEKPSRPRNEQLLLKQVKEEVTSRLAQSLHNAVLINLGKQVQPNQVKRPWDAEVKIGSKPIAPLSPESTILEVFERTDVARKLLILGEPGVGKTTTMLDLAQALVQKAEAEATEPLPVLLNLSSWKDPKAKMQDWLIEELRSKYGVRKDIGKQWLEEKQLLPLLDGLDEVKPEHQESCVQALNQWLDDETRPMSLLVCSRREEYASYATNLQLNGAILLQSLTTEQLEQYLSAINQPDLWRVLEQDAALLELVKTPLLMSITVLSYEELSLVQWQQVASTKERLELLLDAYVKKVLHREIRSKAYGKHPHPTARQTRHWLIFLSRQLQKESQTEFLIEKMQPEKWLLREKQKWAYSLLAAVIGALSCGLLGGLFFGLIDQLMGALNGGLIGGLMFGLVSGLIVGSLIGVLGAWSDGLNYIEPLEAMRITSLPSVKQEILRAISSIKQEAFQTIHEGRVEALVTALSGALMVGLAVGLTFGLTNGLFFGLIAAFSSILTGGVVNDLVNSLRIEIETRIKPNQGIWNSARNAAILVVISLMLAPVLFITLWYFLDRLNHIFDVQKKAGIIALSIAGLAIFNYLPGGKACTRHFSLRYVLYRNGSIPWNYARFLDYCTDRLLLQRIGGRYRFIHKLLQDHFAAMPLEKK
jgi:DNA polymerase III delta prime subunit